MGVGGHPLDVEAGDQCIDGGGQCVCERERERENGTAGGRERVCVPHPFDEEGHLTLRAPPPLRVTLSPPPRLSLSRLGDRIRIVSKSIKAHILLEHWSPGCLLDRLTYGLGVKLTVWKTTDWLGDRMPHPLDVERRLHFTRRALPPPLPTLLRELLGGLTRPPPARLSLSRPCLTCNQGLSRERQARSVDSA